MNSPPDDRCPVIVDAIRTPIGRAGGMFAGVRPDDLAAHVLRALVDRTPAALTALRDVYLGAANQAGEDNRNVARMAVLLADLGITVPGVTVNRLCGSGLEAVVQAAKSILVGEGDVYLAGGVESMTRAPLVSRKPEAGQEREEEVFDSALGWRMVNPRLAERGFTESLGATAENVARRCKISRRSQDDWALVSHERAAIATDAGHFLPELAPLRGAGEAADAISADEGIRRDTSESKLARLAPAFVEGGTVTAGNASPLSDGAAALLLMSRSHARRLGLQPLASIVSWGHAGVHPSEMGLGPVPATHMALGRANLEISALDHIEVNEAFASQVIACVRQLGLPEERVNPLGGAIALGHPLGCSGARILTTLVHALMRTGQRYGLATMCVGVGQGIACVIERQ